MGLKFSVLSSGSTGNATVVANDEVKLLIDAGFSAKRMDQLMQEVGLTGAELSAIFVTHEHSDHIKGLGAFARKHGLPIYANRKTWEELDKQIGEIADDNRRVMDTGSIVEWNSLKVESFGISHDAAEPVAYCIQCGSEKLSVATDLGYMSGKVKDKIGDSDVLVLESNHDIEMLRMGRYPWNIKRRILSDLGHLSNEAAAEGLCDIWTRRTKRVYLAHLSQNHNLLELARMTLQDILEQQGIAAREQAACRVMDTYFDRPTKWDVLAD